MSNTEEIVEMVIEVDKTTYGNLKRLYDDFYNGMSDEEKQIKTFDSMILFFVNLGIQKAKEIVEG